MFSNLETGIKEQLAGRSPWIKQRKLAKDDLVFKHFTNLLSNIEVIAFSPPFFFSSFLFPQPLSVLHLV